MADANHYTKYQPQNQANSSKYATHFFYKALIFAIFLIVLPLFPSQAPEFINQTLNTRGWEFLHLVFVGIAISYGLFSRRNDDTEKDNNNYDEVQDDKNNLKFDNAQSYVSRFLHVSSVFDDEVDSPPKSEEINVQTWNNQYYRNDPVVVVAEENSALDKEQIATSSRICEKPLLLPLRSLKPRVIDADVHETGKESTGVSASISRSSSGSGSTRFSIKNKIGDFWALDYQDLEEKWKDDVVLPSPIPWRSRSGRMEAREEAESPLYNLPPSIEESEYNRSFKSQVPRYAQPASATSSPKLSPSLPSLSSPKKFSVSPSLASEAQEKTAEDFVRKKIIYRSPTPPPPPPPPPPAMRKSSSMNPSSSANHDEAFVKREVKPCLKMERKNLNSGGNLSMHKSDRTISLGEVRKERDFDDRIDSKAERRLKEVEATEIQRTGRKTVGFDQSSVKSERLNMPQPILAETSEEEKQEFVEMETDEESETEEQDDGIGESPSASGTEPSLKKEEAAASSVGDGGPDVDKKADEFIAKFREQIRLQRIESIKKRVRR